MREGEAAVRHYREKLIGNEVQLYRLHGRKVRDRPADSVAPHHSAAAPTIPPAPTAGRKQQRKREYAVSRHFPDKPALNTHGDLLLAFRDSCSHCSKRRPRLDRSSAIANPAPHQASHPFRADQDLGNVKQATAGIYSRLTGGVRKAPSFVTINSGADRILLPAARAALSAPHAQFGGSPIGCARSTHFASASIRGSEYLGPTICSPTGSFDEVSPAGTLAAGSAASETRKVCAIQSM